MQYSKQDTHIHFADNIKSNSTMATLELFQRAERRPINIFLLGLSLRPFHKNIHTP